MIIALRGEDESGKDTIADYMVRNYGFEQLAFATDMKEGVAKLLTLEPDEVDDFKLDGYVDVAPMGHDVSGRQFIRNYANGIRDIFGDDVWAKRTLDRTVGVSRVVISDLRFQPEFEGVHGLGGEVWAGTGDNGDVPFDICDYEIDNGGVKAASYARVRSRLQAQFGIYA